MLLLQYAVQTYVNIYVCEISHASSKSIHTVQYNYEMLSTVRV